MIKHELIKHNVPLFLNQCQMPYDQEIKLEILDNMVKRKLANQEKIIGYEKELEESFNYHKTKFEESYKKAFKNYSAKERVSLLDHIKISNSQMIAKDISIALDEYQEVLDSF